MREPQVAHGLGDAAGLLAVERAREPGRDIAEGAGARANRAEDHEGRLLLVPAFADVGTGRLLADGDEALLSEQRAGLAKSRRARRLDANPVGLSRHGLVGLVRLLRVARPQPRVVGEQVEGVRHGGDLARLRPERNPSSRINRARKMRGRPNPRQRVGPYPSERRTSLTVNKPREPPQHG
jgi:hypothetical protein